MTKAAFSNIDPVTQATVTVAWVIVANKPFYPLYVWWLVGSGVQASLATLFSAPFFLAIPFIARHHPLIARLALPLVGTIDTVLETKLFGTMSGTELFLAPCMMLAALCFYEREIWYRRAMIAVVFAAFLLTRNAIGEPWHAWSHQELATLLNLNAFAVASLMAFIALRLNGMLISPCSDEKGKT
ncbi:hypothetical protein [Oryzifoliimicrobium ureilyticus]|uniref:hypothetical protein n=1 Tax=Oryzifoliimicrobium ureilyticus TaxID=3113724 RepID=UPI0030766D63